MKIDIITLFPDMFNGPFDMSMLLKAAELGLVEIKLHDLRQYGLGARRTVDDTPYGGGDGMLLKPEPVFAAIEAITSSNIQPRTTQNTNSKSSQNHLDPVTKVVILTPVGQKYDQSIAQDLSKADHLILVAGHYEGFDERIMTLADLQISIGDYILTGGELAAMVVVDSVVRLLPGVLGGQASATDDSFSTGLLEYPQYTRPAMFRDMPVPPVLQQGNHAEIAKWRSDQAKLRTKSIRPDLLT